MAAVIIGLHLVGWVDPTRKVHWLTFEPIRIAIAALPLPWVAEDDRDDEFGFAAEGPRHRNCKVNLNVLRWACPDLHCESQQARGIPRNLQLDWTVNDVVLSGFKLRRPDLGCDGSCDVRI
jgi:hypothetical protein